MSIPFSSKSGWITESMPMYRKQAEALRLSRLASNKNQTRRYRVTLCNHTA